MRTRSPKRSPQAMPPSAPPGARRRKGRCGGDLALRLAAGGVCLLLLQDGASAEGWPGFRDYAKVVAVEPIVEPAYGPVLQRTCREVVAEEDGFEPSPGLDILHQMHHHAEEPRCRDVQAIEPPERVSGYRVTYRYDGHTLTRRLSYRPGERLAVDIRVSPLP